MDIRYLLNEVLPQRQQEIEEGKNLGTNQPTYRVFDLIERITNGHSDHDLSFNLKGKPMQYGWVDLSLDLEDRVFCTTDKGMRHPEEVTRFWFDREVAFFLTSKAAHDYLDYQSHNLSKEAYVYVMGVGYANHQMSMLLKNDKVKLEKM